MIKDRLLIIRIAIGEYDELFERGDYIYLDWRIRECLFEMRISLMRLLIEIIDNGSFHYFFVEIRILGEHFWRIYLKRIFDFDIPL